MSAVADLKDFKKTDSMRRHSFMRPSFMQGGNMHLLR